MKYVIMLSDGTFVYDFNNTIGDIISVIGEKRAKKFKTWQEAEVFLLNYCTSVQCNIQLATQQ